MRHGPRRCKSLNRTGIHQFKHLEAIVALGLPLSIFLFEARFGQDPGWTEATLRLFYFCNMVQVYVIESLNDKTWYTGIALNAGNRLKDHNSGKNRFTKGHSPWRIIYTESHENWQQARSREKYLKTAAGKRWLEKKYVDLLVPCPTDVGQAGIPVSGTELIIRQSFLRLPFFLFDKTLFRWRN